MRATDLCKPMITSHNHGSTAICGSSTCREASQAVAFERFCAPFKAAKSALSVAAAIKKTAKTAQEKDTAQGVTVKNANRNPSGTQGRHIFCITEGANQWREHSLTNIPCDALGRQKSIRRPAVRGLTPEAFTKSKLPNPLPPLLKIQTNLFSKSIHIVSSL